MMRSLFFKRQTWEKGGKQTVMDKGERHLDGEPVEYSGDREEELISETLGKKWLSLDYWQDPSGTLGIKKMYAAQINEENNEIIFWFLFRS